MRIIIVGASGTIGHQLYADYRKQGLCVVGTCYRRSVSDQLLSFDMTSARLPTLVTDLSAGDYVYLLAASTNMNWIFRNPHKSSELNIIATKQLIDDVLNRDAKLIFISTDQVFDGVSGGYSESDCVNPVTVYGTQKVEIEKYLQSKQGRWCIVRTGWNVSYRLMDHCPVRNTYQALLRPGARMAYDNILNITDVRDTCAALVALTRIDFERIYHVVSTPPITRSAMAELIKSSSRFGDQMEFDYVRFDELERDEYRPKKSWFQNTKSVEHLGIKYVDPEKVIMEKTKLIDHWVEMGVV